MDGIAIYPGSFDPITLGHLDIIERASQLFEYLIVAVGENSNKETLFDSSERVQMIDELCKPFANVQVQSFSGLTAKFAQSVQAKAIIRGIRNELDYQYEFQMAMTNRILAREIDTIFLPTDQRFCHISSRLAKEVASFGGEVDHLVPKNISKQLAEKMNALNRF